MEATALGAPDIFGLFDSFVHPYTSDGQPDPAGVDERCSCAHVTTSNQFHCMQSVEVDSAAFVEGFAQFFAAKVFNNPDEDDCGFAYYKEFLHGDFSIEFPPGTRLPTALPLAKQPMHQRRYASVLRSGREHGVSRDTTPIQ